MHNLNPEDYILQFESQGSNLLFQDLVIEYPYVPMDSLVLFAENKIQSYIRKNILDDLDREGESRTIERTKQMMQSLSEKTKKAIEDRDFYNSKSEFTKDDMDLMVETLQTIAKEYFYFDAIYWDSVYENRFENKTFEENIELIGDFKNTIRLDLSKVYFDRDSYLQVLIKKVSQKFNVEIEDLGWYLVKDLDNLFSGNVLSKEEVSSRADQYVLHWKPGGGGVLYTGQEAIGVISKFRKNINLDNSVLKGKIANPKKGDPVIKGKVKLFLRSEFEEEKMRKDLSQMEEGQILVALTTDPSIIEAMKKASVIITELGGMLSHAAITARELDIPCIVGVENATKILKDGDMLEVDADKGVITILKSDGK